MNSTYSSFSGGIFMGVGALTAFSLISEDWAAQTISGKESPAEAKTKVLNFIFIQTSPRNETLTYLNICT
ncbi:hypothetical protein [Enterobacter roggenkampii]|uniref:hypothetical protein n=1 Tax=Enterobacter roggenkampii TaxID=1812935 RepID=UPI002FFC0FB3|nr:hypothetical protein [Enterobacter roggenkampii]